MPKKLLPGVNDLASVNPELALEWHPTKNGSLKPTMVKANSHEKVFWLGKCGHTWSAQINNRNAHGRGCPYCSKQLVLEGFNDLASQYPELAKQWDTEKNNKKPNEIIAGGNNKYYWLCEKGHSWETSIAKRKRGDGCPYCGNKKLLVGFNDLATTAPDLALEWDYDLNEKTPQAFLAGSNSFAHWKCKYGHTWYAAINSRRAGKGCPYCAGQKVWPGFNDLASKNPELAAEWDYDKNKKTPSEVTASSSLSFYWKCKFGHSWQATITNRHQGRGCPECDKKNKTSFPEQVILFYIRKTYPNSINRYKDAFINGMELDIYIPTLQTGIEYDGPFHSSEEALVRDLKKYQICQGEGIRLIRVSTRNDAPQEATCDIFIHSDYDYNNYDALDEVMRRISEVLPLNGPFDTKKELIQIKKGYLQSIIDNSLVNENQELCLEWNYEKNDGLLPEMFTSGSGEKVWWKCCLGHAWEASINSRSRGNGCPYCSGQKVLPGFNDLSHLRPDLAEEWDYDKNEEILPTQVTVHSSKIVWWTCPNGHGSYRMSVSHRSQGRGCRQCRNEKAGVQFRKPVSQYSIDGELLNNYISATEASKMIGVSVSAITKACRGVNKTCAGYVFKYTI